MAARTQLETAARRLGYPAANEPSQWAPSMRPIIISGQLSGHLGQLAIPSLSAESAVS